jgi:hypothetical protein
LIEKQTFSALHKKEHVFLKKVASMATFFWAEERAMKIVELNRHLNLIDNPVKNKTVLVGKLSANHYILNIVNKNSCSKCLLKRIFSSAWVDADEYKPLRKRDLDNIGRFVSVISKGGKILTELRVNKGIPKTTKAYSIICLPGCTSRG